MSIELLVIILVAAAAVVAYLAIPSRRGSARQYLLEGFLTDPGGIDEQMIELECKPDGNVRLTRRGLQLTAAERAGGKLPDDVNAVSLAVTVVGFDISIEERMVFGGHSRDNDNPDTAIFVLNFLGPERYHVKYNSEAANRMTAFTLAVKPGLKVAKALSR